MNKNNNDKYDFLHVLQVTGGAYKTIIYLIENGFLDSAIIERAVCPVVIELCDAEQFSLDTSDRHANAVGVS